MHAQVVHNRIDTFTPGWYPALNPLQKINPVDGRAASIGLSQRFTTRWLEGAKDVAFATPAIINLLGRTLSGLHGWRWQQWLSLHHGLPWKAFGRFGSHLIHTNDGAVFRRRGIELFYRPLFSAKAESTRSPNQLSCLRQRKPSASSKSPIR